MSLLDPPPVTKPQGDVRYARRLRSQMMAPRAVVNQVMASAPTVGSVTTTPSISSGLSWPSAQQQGSGNQPAVTGEHFTYSCAAGLAGYGTSSPDFNYVHFTSLSNPTSVGGAVSAPYCVDFWHDGTTLELSFKQLTGGVFRLRVDGQLVSATNTAVSTSNGSLGYVLITFGSRAVRRIRLEAYGLPWGGVITGVTESVWRAEVRGPRCIVIGDSFVEGANGVGANASFPRSFGERMGWDDTWASGVGGTGYLNTGTGGQGRTTFRGRLANDVIPWAPDVLIWTGGHNDTSFIASDVQTEALLCYQAIASALPNCLQIVTSPLWGPGIRSYGTLLIPIRDAIKAASTSAGLAFLDALQFPLDVSAVSTTFASTASSGATSVSLAARVPIGSTINIGSGVEYNRVAGVSGGGPYTHTLQFALSAQRNSGTTVVQAGGGLWTGTGKVGATTGDGNSDLLVSNDGVHPTQEGQEAIAAWLAGAVAKYVLPVA